METLWRPSRGPAVRAEPLKCREDDRQCRWKPAELPRRPAMRVETGGRKSEQELVTDEMQ